MMIRQFKNKKLKRVVLPCPCFLYIHIERSAVCILAPPECRIPFAAARNGGQLLPRLLSFQTPFTYTMSALLYV